MPTLITVEDDTFFSDDPKTVPSTFKSIQNEFYKGSTLSIDFRKKQLSQLYKLIDENTKDIIEAIQKTIKRPYNELLLTSVSMMLAEVAHQFNNIDTYTQPKKVSLPPHMLTDSAELQYVPRGAVLIVGTWNWPAMLMMLPLAGAIASGCTVIVRPSEVVNELAVLLSKLFPKYMDQSCYKVVLGGVPVMQSLLDQPWDMVFCTGSCRLGKIVATAAAKHMTPVVLELGGKNPVLVDETVDLSVVAKRVAWGRYCLNAGQICLGPEYVLIPRKLQAKFIEELKKTLTEWFGDNPQLSPDFGRIVNHQHWNRLNHILHSQKLAKKIVFGGQSDESDRYIAPTILSDVDESDVVMREEVFGPILSIYPLDDMRDALPIIRKRGKPLCFYIFSKNQTYIQDVLSRTDSGGVVVNDVVIQNSLACLPFGGTGTSGQGTYHGWYSFLAFSHERPVLYKYPGLEIINKIRCPPFTDVNAKVFRALTEEKMKTWNKWVTPVAAAASLGGVAYYLQSKL